MALSRASCWLDVPSITVQVYQPPIRMKAAVLTHQTLTIIAGTLLHAKHHHWSQPMHRHLLAASIMLASICASLAAPALAADAPKRTLTLTGQAEVTAAPDMAVISAGTVSEAKTARAALTANNEAMAKVIATIEAAGVENKDIQTANFSVQPKYVYPKASSSGEQQPPRIVGYTVSNSLSVIVRDLAKAGGHHGRGRIIRRQPDAGVELHHCRARNPCAMKRARRPWPPLLPRANLYAQAAGVKLGPILSISEAGGPPPTTTGCAHGRARPPFAEASVPVAQGEQSISATVNIVWGLE
jgi:uncharacterized protein YggE